MLSLIAQFLLFSPIRRADSVTETAMRSPSVANDLLESADACAGRDPRHSAELRSAALASLSFVR